MPFWPLLLRVLLVVALVLNGTTAAVAGVVPMHAHASEAAAVEQAAVPEHGCDSMAAASDKAPDQAPMPEPGKHPAPDCCKASPCSCACVQGAQAGAPVVTIGPAAPVADPLQPPRSARHAAPALPHLIRPPIG